MEFMNNEQIGQTIKKARLAKGLTQADLADKLKIGRTAVTKWENGIIKNLKRDTIQRIADILEISPLTIIGVSDKQDAPQLKNFLVSGIDEEGIERIDYFVSLERNHIEYLLVPSKDFTPAQFEQIKQFIGFIQSQNENK